MNHSPEPWQIGEEHESKADICDVNGNLIGTIRQFLGIAIEPNRSQKDANPQKIIKCVNALNGVPNHVLDDPNFRKKLLLAVAIQYSSWRSRG